jgi:hypothetical protein
MLRVGGKKVVGVMQLVEVRALPRNMCKGCGFKTNEGRYGNIILCLTYYLLFVCESLSLYL